MSAGATDAEHLEVVRATPLARGERAVVGVNSFGFGGQNVSLVMTAA